MLKPRVPRREVIQPLNESYRFIVLTQNQITRVDTADFEWLSKWNWFALWDKNTHSFYAVRRERINGKRAIVSMASEILKCGPGKFADHISHDTLDNRRKNLRKATHRQNICNRRIRSDNTSGYIGVRWHKASQKWMAEIGHKRKSIHLGLFMSIEKAARAYDRAAKKYHREFAAVNDPLDEVFS